MPGESILRVEDLTLDLRNQAAKPLFGAAPLVRILDRIGFSLERGESLGIVGESGSGKTSLGRTLVRLYEPSGGTIMFDGQDISHATAARMRPLRSKLQMIFQDPQSSLNPRHRIGHIVTQPLRIFGELAHEREARVKAGALLERVGLPPAFASRYPHQLSGGQRQRVGIARAIALKPSLVVADEIVSGLDVSSQAQILALLRELKSDLGLALIFISHDLSVIRVLCDRTLVLWRGTVVETGPTEQLFASPQRNYTRTLLDSIPLPAIDPGWVERGPAFESVQDEKAAS